MDWTTTAIDKAGSQAALARALGVSDQAVAFWRTGERKPDPATCTALDLHFGIPRWRTRPTDWASIWPELVGTRGAPKVRAAA